MPRTLVRTLVAVALVAAILAVVPGGPAPAAAAVSARGAGEVTAASAPARVVDVAAGGYFTCALLEDGRVKCWGYNGFGALGAGDTVQRGDEPGELGDRLPTVGLGTGRAATRITAGYAHACALLDDGTVRCWGSNTAGQLGVGDTDDRGDEPGELGDALPAVPLTDTSDPVITLVTPADGAVYGHRQPVTADYTCADTSGTGIDTCEGNVGEGAHIDTATLGSHPFTVVATDHAGHEAEALHTYTVAEPRPDAWIKLGATGPYQGDDRCNTTARSQTVTGRAGPGHTVTYAVTVENDATVADVLSLRGTASDRRFRVTYTAAGEDITAEVTAGTYTTPGLAPGARHLVKVAVKVRQGATVGSSLAGFVTARSSLDPTSRDRVGFTTRRR